MNEATIGPRPEIRFTVPLDDERAKRLALTGGKGTNLARLVAAGLPVPRGFCVTTAAYRALVDAPEVRTAIESLDSLDSADPEAIAEAAADVRSKLRCRDLPDEVRRAVADALDGVGADAYAVRSSATAEDLPTASFAGQHESFLGVDPEAVLDRVRDCVASLFTDRAVSYRLRNDVPHDEVAMAVVVQEQVDPDVAGVLFTADPVTGNRRIASVDANYGLGDTVVAGEVSPDNARVDRRTGEVVEYELGEKRRALRVNEGAGGTETVDLSPDERRSRALSDAELRALVDLGDEVEVLLGEPQDVEWALVDGEFVLLQSRPITSLFPVPSPRPDGDHLRVYFSVGHQQAMAEALPPLVVDWLREMLNDSVARVRSPDADDAIAVEAGHRVYVDLTPLLSGGFTRRVALPALASMSDPAARALADLFDERRESLPRRAPTEGLVAFGRALGRLGPAVVSVAPALLARFVRPFVRGPPDPDRVRRRVEAAGERLADRVSRSPSLTERARRAFEAVDLATMVAEVGSRSMPVLLAGVVAGAVLERLYPDAEDELDALEKGFDGDVATRIDRHLDDLTDAARRHPEVAAALEAGASLSEVERADGGEEFVAALDAFLEEFGHRTGSELDLSRPRWRDDPATVLRAVANRLAGDGPEDHREHLERLRRDAERAAADLEARAGRGVLGPVKRPIVRQLIRTYRGGIQLREHHKHGAAHVLTAVHDVLADAGETLAADGRLDRADDVWYLRRAELLAALDGDSPGVDVDERRATHDRYASMTAPPVLTSEGETPAVAEAAAPSENALVGTPVSAGVVEGPARVVRDPSEESLEPGEILVAPSTDVGWTPLFQNAAGLVMDVGGRMTHGAVVAREYGIPAVVSVANGTTEIRTGERIRIDGSRGTVELLDRDGV